MSGIGQRDAPLTTRERTVTPSGERAEDSPPPTRRRLTRRLRTAAGLPGRLVAVEDQGRDLEARVATRLDEVRFELAEIRRTLAEMNVAATEALQLTGELLRSAESRLDALEGQLGWDAPLRALPSPPRDEQR
jgi:hypothetical protein